MKTPVVNVVFLGRRWSRSGPLAEPRGRRAALDHYAGHRSFPIPAESAPVAGAGVLVVDTSDFSAVQAVHSYRGDWLVIAFMPDMFVRNEDYEIRLVTETMIYGGLRDLELAGVVDHNGIKCVFIVDTPGRETSETNLEDLATAVWDLREEWDREPLHPAPWPEVCRGLSLWFDDTNREEKEVGHSPGGQQWVKYMPPPTGESPPRGVQIVCSEPRILAPEFPFLFRRGSDWLAIGRSRPLSDFRVSRIYFQSACSVFGNPESAWPEPGDPGPGPRRRYLETRVNTPRRKGKGPDAYLRQLEHDSRRRHETLPPDTPEFIRRWLGFHAEGNG